MVRIHLSKILGEKRLTQSDLSKKTGIRPSTINEFYHEIIFRINVKHFDKICEALGCEISDLLEHVPSKKPATGKNIIFEEYCNRKKKAK